MSAVDIPYGLSEIEAELYEHLVTHAEFEMKLMVKYEALATSSTPWVGFFAGLIAEDEERHHLLYAQWAQSLRSLVERESGDGLPDLATPDDPAALVETTEALLEYERKDLKELRRLEKSIDDVKDTTVWALVLEVMRADTHKHIAILEFVRHQAKLAQKGR
jgi:hypothetical protein